MKYSDFSKDTIHDFMSRHNIVLKDSKNITNVTMQHVIPSGYTYTIYYVDINNKKQSEKISRKSETTFKDYMIKNGENLGEKYINICKIAFCILIAIIIFKGIIIRIQKKNIC